MNTSLHPHQPIQAAKLYQYPNLGASQSFAFALPRGGFHSGPSIKVVKDNAALNSEAQMATAARALVSAHRRGEPPKNWDPKLWAELQGCYLQDRCLFAAMLLVWETDRLNKLQAEKDCETYVPCGDCGATQPIQRCVGCMHDFTKVAIAA